MTLKMPFVGGLVTLLSLCVATSTATYTAAVVEFRSNQLSLPSNRIKDNLEGFERVLNSIGQNGNGGVNIIVFPEDAILGALYLSREDIAPYLEEIPETTQSQDKIIPCSDATFVNRPILQKLSCLASEHQVVLVANMGDIQPCSNEPTCPTDKKYHFNTNVVFETDGTLIAKYHKVNLYTGEAVYFNPGSYSNNTCVSFTTSFGVTLGLFTCYDMLFAEPGKCLLSKGIKNFVLPTEWMSSYPFYVSIAVQQGWSRKHGVNFLAANQHFEMANSTGSGIYSNGVAVHYIFTGDLWTAGTGQAIVADLPEDPTTTLPNATQVSNRSNTDKATTKVNTYLNYTLLTSGDGGDTEVEYHNTQDSGLNLSCKLEYSIKSMPTGGEQYGLGAYIGTSVDDSQFKFAVCTLVKCTQAGKCGEPVDGYQANAIFSRVAMSGTFADGSDVYASALGSGLELLNPSFVKLEMNSLSISGYDQPLLTANLWTRVYNN